MRTTLFGLLVLAAAGCGPSASLDRLQEARRTVREMEAELSTSIDTGQRAVMATDASVGDLAHESAAATDRMRDQSHALTSALDALGYDREASEVSAFAHDLDAYRELNQRILALALESTNVKAQRLSFDAAWTAADAVEKALAALAGDDPERRASAARAMAAVREMQALQAPHIAEPDDAAMTRLETRMDAAAARAAAAVATLDRPGAEDRKAAEGALERFLDVHREIVALSRRNTNVQALALSLSQRTRLAATCQSRLADVQQALELRRLGGTR